MIRFDLYWKHEGVDINLGSGFHTVVPPIGGVMLFGTGHGSCWRVVGHYQYLIEEGSMTYRTLLNQSNEPLRVTLFVEPAEGPFEP